MSTISRTITRFASTSSISSSPRIVVIGAGAGGLAAANQIYNTLKSSNKTPSSKSIKIIDPSSTHDYQPGWTVVGGGLAKKEKFRKSLSDLIDPNKFEHVQIGAKGFEPGSNEVVLSDGSKLGYDYLVVAAGIQINWDNIKGLTSALENPEKSKISSIYSYETADKTWDLINNFKEGQGEAIFTQPFGPVKCAGAPQKVAYLANSAWTSTSLKIPSTFITGMPSMFAVPKYSAALETIRSSKGINGLFNTNLISVDASTKIATFEVLAGEKKGEKIEKEYGILHVVPPMGPKDWIKGGPLADAAGWVDVDQGTLQHKKYENVFSLGDCSSLPTSKTAAAITAQTPVLAHNLLQHLETGKISSPAIYDGYTSCPLFVGNNELLLAEFKYGGVPKETFGSLWDQSKPNRAFYHLTKDVFPAVYFSQMLKGNWYGPKGLFPPQFVPS